MLLNNETNLKSPFPKDGLKYVEVFGFLSHFLGNIDT